MYGIPENVEWSFLLGKELLRVCIGMHQVSLDFEGGVSIRMECEFGLLRITPAELKSLDLPRRSTMLVSLLGAKVATVTNRAQMTLLIAFSNSETLSIHDSNQTYESFQVTFPNGEIVV